MKCVVCGLRIYDYGHNAEPVAKGRCCDFCNFARVIPERIKEMRTKVWFGDVPEEDHWGHAITKEFVDGKTKMGPWAFMAPQSFRLFGVGLGTGRGQRYQKQEDGQWVKVEG